MPRAVPSEGSKRLQMFAVVFPGPFGALGFAEQISLGVSDHGLKVYCEAAV